MVGKEKFLCLAYADGIALVASREEELNETMRRLERFFHRKEFAVNVNKTKVMVFR